METNNWATIYMRTIAETTTVYYSFLVCVLCRRDYRSRNNFYMDDLISFFLRLHPYHGFHRRIISDEQVVKATFIGGLLAGKNCFHHRFVVRFGGDNHYDFHSRIIQ